MNDLIVHLNVYKICRFKYTSTTKDSQTRPQRILRCLTKHRSSSCSNILDNLCTIRALKHDPLIRKSNVDRKNMAKYQPVKVEMQIPNRIFVDCVCDNILSYETHVFIAIIITKEPVS